MMKSICGLLCLTWSASSHAQITPETLLRPQTQQTATTPAAAPQTPVVTPQQMDALQPDDRAAVRTELERFDPLIRQHCTTQRDGTQRLDQSCGTISVQNGDPNFQPEQLPSTSAEGYYARIPRDSQVSVITGCESDGRFRTRIYYTDEQGRRQIFRTPFDRNQEACLTSPGQYSNPEHPTYRTQLPTNITATGHVTTWHVVSDRYTYEGAQMPWSVWLNNSGYAYHSESETTPVDGYPASAGCFRLTEPCARGLFYLARRVGTNNMRFSWRGYNHPDTGQVCDRPGGSPSPINITAQGSQQARQQITQNHGNWFSNWWRETFRSRPPSNSQVPSQQDIRADR